MTAVRPAISWLSGPVAGFDSDALGTLSNGVGQRLTSDRETSVRPHRSCPVRSELTPGEQDPVHQQSAPVRVVGVREAVGPTPRRREGVRSSASTFQVISVSLRGPPKKYLRLTVALRSSPCWSAFVSQIP